MIREDLVQKLRDATADRPAHAAYLETLLAAPTAEAVLEIDEPKGVSISYGEALVDDVYSLRLQAENPQYNTSWPNAYRNARVKYGRLQADREHARQRREEQSLASRFTFGAIFGPEEDS